MGKSLTAKRSTLRRSQPGRSSRVVPDPNGNRAERRAAAAEEKRAARRTDTEQETTEP